MKVLEIKNGLAKIAYNSADGLILSGFLIIEDENMPYVGQIVNLKAEEGSNYAIVKLLFTFNADGVLKSYDGSIPSVSAAVSKLPSDELIDIIPVETPIRMGWLAQQEIPLQVDKSIFEQSLTVCSDSQKNTNILLKNFIKQLEPLKQKSVIFDVSGDLECDDKLVFGRDFKLPLNYNAINFIYDNELDDVNADSKAIIQDVFAELQEYVKIIPEKYIPFETFLDVVDQQYRATGIVELILLKNKLLKYRDKNVYAQELKDFLSISMAVEKADTVVVDISSVSADIQREVIGYTYDVFERLNTTIYSFVELDNEVGTKKLLKKFIERHNVYTTIICPHDYKYLPELKQASANLIIFAPLAAQHDFAAYNTFLNKLNSDEFIIYGNLTQTIPFIVKLDNLEAMEARKINTAPPAPPQPDEFDSTDDDDEVSFDNFSAIVTPVIPVAQSLPEPVEPEPAALIPEPVMEEPLIEIPQEPEEVEEPLPAEPEEVFQEETLVTEEPMEFLPLEEMAQENPDFEEPVFEEEAPEAFEEPAVEQPQITEYIEPEDDFLGDILTDDDLNMIDSLSQDEIVEGEEEYSTDALANLVDEATNYMQEELPVYPAGAETGTEIQFKAGDAVTHPKYGEGVVEKMIQYGNKNLLSINFDKIGRRLLDPAISDITLT